MRAERTVELTEATLARARSGDAGACQKLARIFYTCVYSHVLAYEARLGSEADALDITQGTFERAFKDLEKYTGDGPFERWLQRIARRTAADFYRRPASSPSASSGELSTNLASPDSTSPLDGMLRWEDDERVRLALSCLSPEHHQVLQCRFVRELTVKETAKEMRRTDAAVKMLQLRALRSLEMGLTYSGSTRVGKGGA